MYKKRINGEKEREDLLPRKEFETCHPPWNRISVASITKIFALYTPCHVNRPGF